LFTICYSVFAIVETRACFFLGFSGEPLATSGSSILAESCSGELKNLFLLGAPMKMPVKDPSKKTSSSKPPEPNRCAFETSDGRRCRLPRSASHASLCAFHSREEKQLVESEKLGTELAATVTGNFLTATDINYALGKVFTAASQNRIPMRTAHTLAYLGQLLLMSLPDVKQEFGFRYRFEQWTNMLDRAVRLSPAPPEPELAPAADADSQSTNIGTTPAESGS
jgi:hypothetical protein